MAESDPLSQPRAHAACYYLTAHGAYRYHCRRSRPSLSTSRPRGHGLRARARNCCSLATDLATVPPFSHALTPPCRALTSRCRPCTCASSERAPCCACCVSEFSSGKKKSQKTKRKKTRTKTPSHCLLLPPTTTSVHPNALLRFRHTPRWCGGPVPAHATKKKSSLE